MFKRTILYIGIIFALTVGSVFAVVASPQAQGIGNTIYLPFIGRNDSGTNPPPPVACGQIGNPLLEGFEGSSSGWQVSQDTTGGTITQSSARAGVGTYSVLVSTSGANQTAQIRATINDNASAHIWNERRGTYRWQQACVFIPSTTVAKLGTGQYLTLAGSYPSAGGSFGWFLRVRSGGELYVMGYPATGNSNVPVEFQVYGKAPLDRWFELEIGLHSQAGPGVKRAFAFLVDGNFYGWYHQGNMASEVFDRMAMGIVNTNSPNPLQVYIDQWRQPGSAALPNGPDLRPVTAYQAHDYRNLSGVQWQIDWSTWANDLVLDSRYGLYSKSFRLQSGQNLDRLADLSNGWAEIEIDWPNGTPPANPGFYYGAMVGFRKDINREENLEVIPTFSNGIYNLTLEAWVNGGAINITNWQMPHIPRQGDMLLVRWEQVNATQLHVQASYFDASTANWNRNIIDHLVTDNSIGSPAVDFTDGYHNKSEFTVDTVYYSIRQLKMGTLASYPNP